MSQSGFEAHQSNNPREATALEEAQIDHIVDTQGLSYSLARASVLGVELDPQVDIEVDPLKPSLPGKPLSFPKSGHVRDFHDGGRDDAYRGGFAAHLEDKLNIPGEVVATLRAARDKTAFDNIVSDYQGDALDDPDSLESHKLRAIARWRAHISRHYPDLNSDQVNDVAKDMAEVLS